MQRFEELTQRLTEAGLTQAESAELEVLLQQHPEHQNHLAKTLEIEALLRSLDNTFDVSEGVMRRVRAHVDERRHRAAPPGPRSPWRSFTESLGRHPLRVAAAVAITCSVATASAWLLARPAGATMTIAEGVIDTASNQQRTAAQREVHLASQDHVALPRNANAAISFRNGVRMDLGLEADMTMLRDPAETPDTVHAVRVAAGRVSIDAPAAGTGSEFRIETAHGLAGFSGARVELFTSPKATQVRVESGVARVRRDAQDRPVELHGGQYAILREGLSPVALPVLPARCIFDEQADALSYWTAEAGANAIVRDDSKSGTSSLRLTPQQGRVSLAGMAFPIREKPSAGEFRFVSFAWRKDGGGRIGLQFDHADEAQDRRKQGRAAGYRFDAGPGPQVDTLAQRLDGKSPVAWWVVTRDLWQDFGDFTLTGLTFICPDGKAAAFDAIYVGKTPGDLADAQRVVQASARIAWNFTEPPRNEIWPLASLAMTPAFRTYLVME